jgi:hypothetical protein
MLYQLSYASFTANPPPATRNFNIEFSVPGVGSSPSRPGTDAGEAA